MIYLAGSELSHEMVLYCGGSFCSICVSECVFVLWSWFQTEALTIGLVYSCFFLFFSSFFFFFFLWGLQHLDAYSS